MQVLIAIAVVSIGVTILTIFLAGAEKRIPGVNEPGYLPEDAKL